MAKADSRLLSGGASTDNTDMARLALGPLHDVGQPRHLESVGCGQQTDKKQRCSEMTGNQ